LKKDIASLKWDFKKLRVNRTEADNITKRAVEQISEVPLKAQDANQRASTKPQISPGRIIFQYSYSYNKIKPIKVIFHTQLRFLIEIYCAT